MKVTSLRYMDNKFHHPSPKIKKIPKNTNGRLAILALAWLLVSLVKFFFFFCCTYVYDFHVIIINGIANKLQQLTVKSQGVYFFGHGVQLHSRSVCSK